MSVKVNIENNNNRKIHITHTWCEERKVKTGPNKWDWNFQRVWLTREFTIDLKRVEKLAERANSGEFIPTKISGDEKLAIKALYEEWSELLIDLNFDLDILGQQLSGALGPEDFWPDDPQGTDESAEEDE